MSSGTREEQDSTEQRQKKHLIAEALIEAMRNHPPLKQDMYTVLNLIKEAFPELEALKGPISRLPGVIPLSWWEILPIHDIFMTVERRLKKKPFHPERAKDAFAHLLWLATKLLFGDKLINMADRQETTEETERTVREIRAESIQANIRLTNALFKRITHSKRALLFREDVPDFFTRLPTACRGLSDFLVKIQSFGILFEVNLKPLRELVPMADSSWGSIKLVERWLEDSKLPDYSQVTNVWKGIIALRKIPPTHASMSDEIVGAIEFFGQRFPVDFSRLWDSILESFFESLINFQEIISNLQNAQ